MGLQYDIFFVRLPAEDLLARLMATGLCTDLSALMQQDRAWEAESSRTFDVALQKGSSAEDILAAIKAEPEEPALRAYRERPQGQFRVWWMPYPPDPTLSVGMFSSHRFYIRPYQALLLGLLSWATVPEVMLVEYSSVTNGGCAFRVDGTTLEQIRYPMLPEENENYPVYAERIAGETGYPLPGWHRFCEEWGWKPLPWTHEIALFSPPAI